MADLVGAELPNARERGGDRIVGVAGAGQACANKGLEDDEILPSAKRAEENRPFMISPVLGSAIGWPYDQPRVARST